MRGAGKIRLSLLGALIAALAVLWPAAAPGATIVAPSGTLSGESVIGRKAGGGPLRRAVPLRVRNRSAYASAKRQADLRAGARRTPSTASGISPLAVSSPRAAVFGSLNEAGLSAASQIASQGLEGEISPPDTTGAIGPSDYVEMVNDMIVAYSRSSLTMVGSPVDLQTFTKGTAVCDPQIKYDPQTSRWFYAAIRCDGTKVENAIYLGFSKTSDPTNLSTGASGGWCGYEYSTGGLLEDYPKLGLDHEHIVLGTNSFEASTEGFVTAHIIVAPKPGAGTIEACPAAPKLSTFGGAGAEQLKTSLGHEAFTPEPATVSDTPSLTGYVVAADLASSNAGEAIMVWKVAGAGATPKLEQVGDPKVARFELPPSVPQPQTTDQIDSSDMRLTQAVAAEDPKVGEEAVWTQHTVAGGAGTVVRWYELLPGKAEVGQEGTISDASKYVFNGAIAPTRAGGAVIDYNTGGAAAKVQIMAQSRIGSAPLGTMNTPLLLGSSEATDTDFTCTEGPCRWGDYAGASVDPTEPNVVWGSSQLNGTASFEGQPQWSTRNFALEPNDLSPTASFTFSPSRGAVGSPVSFNASGSGDPDGTIAGYSWNFGEGATGSGVTPTHTYSAAGKFEVTLTVTDNGGKTASVKQPLEVGKGQTITFTSTPPSSATVGGSTYAVSATASSGLQVSFSSATPPVCSVSGNTVTFVGAGTCTINADQAGDSTYEAAPTVQQSFTVASPASSSTGSGPESLSSPPPSQALATSASQQPPPALAEVRATASSATGMITLTVPTLPPGTLTWVLTFPNGRFGVFAARAGGCRHGYVRLGGRCRPASVVFAKGTKVLTVAGSLAIRIAPTTAAGRQALRNARKHRRSLPLTMMLRLQPAGSGAAVVRVIRLTLAPPRRR